VQEQDIGAEELPKPAEAKVLAQTHPRDLHIESEQRCLLQFTAYCRKTVLRVINRYLDFQQLQISYVYKYSIIFSLNTGIGIFDNINVRYRYTFILQHHLFM
jgi:hypothetical protein